MANEFIEHISTIYEGKEYFVLFNWWGATEIEERKRKSFSFSDFEKESIAVHIVDILYFDEDVTPPQNFYSESYPGEVGVHIAERIPDELWENIKRVLQNKIEEEYLIPASEAVKEIEK